MPWIEVFAVFIVCHLVGDYMLQTEWQALNKRGGLSWGSPTSRLALLSHVATYTLSFVPAAIWLLDDLGAGVIWLLALIAVPHLIQDDGSLLFSYARRIKKTDLAENPLLGAALDQTFHIVALFFTAILAAS
jgi:type IV secretory pathway TrbD component